MSQDNPHMPYDSSDFALIECAQGHYSGILTMEPIDALLYRLYCEYLVNPDYLFVSEEGKKQLSAQRANFRHLYPLNVSFYFREIELYPNQYTGKRLHVVVLPTLPDDTFLVGNLNILQKMMSYGQTQLASTTEVKKHG